MLRDLVSPILGCRLIKDDFYAWQWGPVEVKTYESFSKYKSNPIRSISNKTNDELEDIKSKPEIVAFLERIYKLVDINPFVLSEKTHTPGGPWSKTKPYGIIDVQLIKEYFTNNG